MERGPDLRWQVAKDRYDPIPAIRFNRILGEIGNLCCNVYGLLRSEALSLFQPDSRGINAGDVIAFCRQVNRVPTFAFRQAEDLSTGRNAITDLYKIRIGCGPI